MTALSMTTKGSRFGEKQTENGKINNRMLSAHNFFMDAFCGKHRIQPHTIIIHSCHGILALLCWACY